MMNYETFKKQVLEQFPNYLSNNLKDYEIRIYPVKKVNTILDGILLVAPNQGNLSIGSIIYINDMYEDYSKGYNFQDIMKRYSEILGNYNQDVPAMIKNLDKSDKETKIVMMLVNTEQNKEMLKEVPHREILDLSIVYRYVVSIDEGVSSAVINNSFMKNLNMTEEQLYKMAVINTKRLFQPMVTPLSKLLNEKQVLEKPVWYAITNKDFYYGATSILYDDILNNLAEMVKSDLYILPSSIQEVIAVPVQGENLDELRNLVESANRDCVKLEEILSNQVYYYSRNLRKLSIAEEINNDDKLNKILRNI